MESGQHRTTEANNVLQWSIFRDVQNIIGILRQGMKKRARQLVHIQDVLISKLTVAGISDYSCPGRYLIHIQFISTCGGGGGLNPIPQYALLHCLHCHTTDPICAASVKEEEKSELGHLV